MIRIARNSDFRRLVRRHPHDAFREEDILLLREKYPGEVMPEGMTWSLKQLGYLHILDRVRHHELTAVLEVGPGFNFFLPNHLDSHIDYVSADSRGFYEPRMLELMSTELKRGRTVDTLLGKFSPELGDASFDACVSASVLEHVAKEDIEAICTDMWRIIRPGGYTIHAIDLPANEILATVGNWKQAVVAAGFVLEEAETDFDLSKGDWFADPPHTEALAIVMRFNYGYRSSIWSADLSERPTPNILTVLVSAKKPD